MNRLKPDILQLHVLQGLRGCSLFCTFRCDFLFFKGILFRNPLLPKKWEICVYVYMGLLGNQQKMRVKESN